MKRFLLFAFLGCTLSLAAQDRSLLTEYQLPNGLTVMLWENHDMTDVNGYVAVRVGAVDEPKEYTGLAHYLEHMLFKGTQTIGALDWEQEKPLYEEIIRLYDEYAQCVDAKQRDTLAQRINRLSLKEAEVSTTQDFFSLLDGIGASNVNAFTTYDMTCYTSTFPAHQMHKWLTINADRMLNPVFRTFQAELENVFEEYNMSAGSISTQQRNTLFETIYKGHPYERSVIGLPEHLKNPRLSKLIEFFNTWYVANNMALILVGDFQSADIKEMIAGTFGKLPEGVLPERNHNKPDFLSGTKKTVRIGYYPQIYWTFDGVSVSDDDMPALQMLCMLLNNSSQTGLLDKVSIDGEVSGASCMLDARRDMGRIIITAIPYFDPLQQSFDDNAATERIVMGQINKIKSGDIPDWLIEAVKQEINQSYILGFEEGGAEMDELVQSFIYSIPTERIFTANERMQSLTKEDLQRVAHKYFDKEPIILTFEEGDPKIKTLPKPKIKPLMMPQGKETEYARSFKQINEGTIKTHYNDFNDVAVSKLDEHITLHYTPNTKNDIFSLTLRYGVGTAKMPKLEYVVQLMNRAGILPDTEPQEFRRKLSQLGGRIAYGVDDSYLTIQLIGEDRHMKDILELVSLQILMPKLDKKQFDAVKGSELSSRLTQTKMHPLWSSALREYVVYGDKSDFIDVVPFLEVYDMDQLTIITQFQQATKYALDVYYCGTRTPQEVQEVLPLSEGMMASTSPEIREKQRYQQPQIFFLPDNKVQQASIYFYFLGGDYNLNEQIQMDAFNQYFSGGFSGIVMDEIRTKRSLAYTAYGMMTHDVLPDKPTSFVGYIGTQSDKVVDAVQTFIHLTDSMPLQPYRIEDIRTALTQQYASVKPSMRSKAMAYDYWKQLGYTDDPYQVNKDKINSLTFEQIQEYYTDKVQPNPMAIIIVGDPKQIDMKALGKIAKVKRMSVNTLFAPLDLD